MNFLGIAKEVGKGLGVVGNFAAPVLSVFNPALGALVGRISTAVVNAEAQIPADGAGPQKSAMVVSDFNASLALAQSLLKQAGKLLSYDGDLLDKAIAAQVASNNAYAELARSVKIVDVTPPSVNTTTTVIPG